MVGISTAAGCAVACAALMGLPMWRAAFAVIAVWPLLSRPHAWPAPYRGVRRFRGAPLVFPGLALLHLALGALCLHMGFARGEVIPYG